jgi:hypothetical protein
VSQPERRICFGLDEVISMATDLVRVADDLRTHTVEDVNARLIDMVADQLLARAFGPD